MDSGFDSINSLRHLRINMIVIIVPFVSMLLVVTCGGGVGTTERNEAPDHSLVVEEYVDLGVPSIDKEWSIADYRECLRVLSELSREQLPRLDSSRSGVLFLRLIAEDSRFGGTLVDAARGGTSLADSLNVDRPKHVPGSIEDLYSRRSESESMFDREYVALRGARIEYALRSMPTRGELLNLRDALLSSAERQPRIEALLDANWQLLTTADVFSRVQVSSFVRLISRETLSDSARSDIVRIVATLIDPVRQRVSTSSNTTIAGELRDAAHSSAGQSFASELTRLADELNREIR